MQPENKFFEGDTLQQIINKARENKHYEQNQIGIFFQKKFIET